MIKMAEKKSTRIKMKISKNKKFVVSTFTIMGFAQDLKELLEGKRKTIKMKVYPYKAKRPMKKKSDRREILPYIA